MKIKETCTPDAIKERLEEAGWPLLLERPYDEVAVDDICARAGLTKGAFYNRFSSKEEFKNKGLKEGFKLLTEWQKILITIIVFLSVFYAFVLVG